MKNISAQQIKLLDELIDNATELPVESQNLLLMLAKAMSYTRNCIIQHSEIEQPHKPPKNKPA